MKSGDCSVNESNLPIGSQLLLRFHLLEDWRRHRLRSTHCSTEWMESSSWNSSYLWSSGLHLYSKVIEVRERNYFWDITYKVELKMLLVVTKWVRSASRSLPWSAGLRACSDLSIALAPYLYFGTWRDLLRPFLLTLWSLPFWIAGKLESLADFWALSTAGDSILIYDGLSPPAVFNTASAGRHSKSSLL